VVGNGLQVAVFLGAFPGGTMHYFQYSNGTLFCEDVPLTKIAAEVGTPLYLYSQGTFLRHYRRLDQALSEVEHIICFALKSNSNLAVCRALANEGAGTEVVSGGELYRALKAGVPGERIVFNGNGKTEAELSYALESNILMFCVDSEHELDLLNAVAKRVGRKAPIAVRVNPDIPVETHPYVATSLKESKFGVQIDRAMACYEFAAREDNLEAVGIHAHLGSQLLDVAPFEECVSRLADAVKELKKQSIGIRYIDLGGGLGIRYNDEEPLSYEEYADTVAPYARDVGCTVVLEPGRSIVGNAGILLTRVVYVKRSYEKTFIVVDAAMNDLIRPAMYGSYHEIVPVAEPNSGQEKILADIVGGICESGDFLARDRNVPPVEAGDLLAVMSAGAYGAAMSSTYNSRPLVPEALVSGDTFKVIRRRQSYEEMVSLELVEEAED
jgi:diaminopimelate decarboxylase